MTTPQTSEIAATVLAARAGDPDAWARLHRRAAPMVRGVLMARGGLADLEDREQDVFVLAMDRLGQLADPAAFLPWIATIARRHAHAYAPRVPIVTLPQELAAPDSRFAEARHVLTRICALPQCYAEPLTLRLVFGFSGPEIAATLGLSPAYVRINLFRGMRRLRLSLGLDPHGHCLLDSQEAL